MLFDEIKKRMMMAMKSQDVVQKEVMRVVIGEVTMNEARGTSSKSDDDVIAVLRKLMKSNEETLVHATDQAQRETLQRENALLRELLPQAMDVAQIVTALAAVREGICAAKSDGQATGVAMKHLKSLGANADGKDVSEAVRRVRAGAT